MTLCYTQPTARYHESDSCLYYNSSSPGKSSGERVRNLDDIRAKAREAIHQARFLSRSIKMLQHRRTLIRAIVNNHDDEEDDTLTGFDEQHHSNDSSDSDYEPLSSSSYSENTSHLDETLVPDQCGWWDLGEDCSPQTPVTSRRGSPSPSSSDWSSAGSSKSSSALYIDGYEIPACLLESPASNSFASPKTGSNRVAHQQAYKSSQSPSGSPRCASQLTDDQIINEFNAFKELLQQHYFADANTLSQLVKSSWATIATTLTSRISAVTSELLNILANLVRDNQLSADVILFMLQNGLVHNLKSHFSESINNQQSEPVIRLLSSIVMSAPAIIYYLVDLLSNCKFLKCMEESLENSPTSDVRHVLEFYYHLSEMIMKSILDQAKVGQPLIPQFFSPTASSMNNIDFYSPIATLSKLITPKLISIISSNCLSRSNQKEEHLIVMALIVLANSLKLTSIRSELSSNDSNGNSQWTSQILCAFRDSKIENQLNLLMKALDRLKMKTEISDQSSQGAGIGNIAMQTKAHCEQFINFYRQLYDPLVANYALFPTNCCCGLTQF